MKLNKILKKRKLKTIKEYIPYKEVWNNVCVLEDGNIMGGIKINCLNLYLMYEEEQISKIEQFKKILLSMNYKYQILSMDSKIDLNDNLTELKTKLNNEKNVHKQKLLQEDVHYMEMINNTNNIKNRNFYIFVTDNNEKILKEKLSDLVIKFDSINLISGIIKSDEFRKIIYSNINPGKSLDLYYNQNQIINKTFKDKICPFSLKFNEKDILINDIYSSVVTVTTYPSFVNIAWLSSLSNIENTRMSVIITPIDSHEVSKTLKKSISEVKTKLINVTDHNDQILLQNQMADYEELVNKIDRSNEKIVKIGINFLVYANSIEELTKLKEEVKNNLISVNLNGVDLMFEQEKGLKACLPLVDDSLIKDFGLPIPITTLAASFPFVYETLQDDKDSIVLGEDLGGSVVAFDLWKRTNKRNNSNMTVIGKSGSGKSTALKKIIRGNWARGAKVIVIDPEREYKDLCLKVGGDWIDCGSGQSGIINPLEARIGADDTDNYIDIAKHFQIFRTFIKYYFRDLSEYEGTILEGILKKAYNKKGINFDTDISKLSPTDYPIMTDLYNELNNEYQCTIKNYSREYKNSLEKLLSITKRMTDGADSILWNGISTIDAKSDFVVLDIHTLVDSDETVLRTQFFNILSWAWNLVSKSKQPIILVVDEAHLLIDPSNKDGIDFLKRTSKRIRKYNGSLIVSTQNMIDFTADEIKRFGQVIVDNSAYIGIMAQGVKELEALEKMMNLSNSETNFLRTASRGEMLFVISQDTRIPISIVLREEEKELFGSAGGR